MNFLLQRAGANKCLPCQESRDGWSPFGVECAHFVDSYVVYVEPFDGRVIRIERSQ
jgi:hypothetical protein